VALAPVDAVVIGAGAGGGVIAKELATAGLRVVLLESGGMSFDCYSIVGKSRLPPGRRRKDSPDS